MREQISALNRVTVMAQRNLIHHPSKDQQNPSMISKAQQKGITTTVQELHAQAQAQCHELNQVKSPMGFSELQAEARAIEDIYLAPGEIILCKHAVMASVKLMYPQKQCISQWYWKQKAQ